MAQRPTLTAMSRAQSGQKLAALRREGRLPAVVYGHGVESSAISLDAHEFEQLRRRAGSNVLVDLVVDGRRPQPVLVHEVQLDVITRKVLHADLLAVRMTEERTVDVPLQATGTSPADEQGQGTLLHVMEHVKVKALPDHLPSSIEYDVSGLTEVDAAVHVSDLAIPRGVTLLTDPGEIVAKILRSRITEAEPAAAAGETAGAEGSAEGDRTEGGSSGSTSEA
jgi:large subunit ribosomal protein L25